MAIEKINMETDDRIELKLQILKFVKELYGTQSPEDILKDAQIIYNWVTKTY